MIGADPSTSAYGGGDGSPYAVESIGHYVHPETAEDIWPQSYDQAVVDEIVRIGDRESIEMVHRLAREEGLLVGGSSGTAVAAALRIARDAAPGDLVVVLAPDSGRGYLSTYFSENWLLTKGFQDGDGTRPTVGDLISAAGPPRAVRSHATVAEARAVLGLHDEPSADRSALVVLDRPKRADSWSVGDVVGLLPSSALLGLPEDEPIADRVQQRPESAGAGEVPADVIERLPEGQAWIPVLLDGRIVAVVSRAALRPRSAR